MGVRTVNGDSSLIDCDLMSPQYKIHVYKQSKYATKKGEGRGRGGEGRGEGEGGEEGRGRGEEGERERRGKREEEGI